MRVRPVDRQGGYPNGVWSWDWDCAVDWMVTEKKARERAKSLVRGRRGPSRPHGDGDAGMRGRERWSAKAGELVQIN